MYKEREQFVLHVKQEIKDINDLDTLNKKLDKIGRVLDEANKKYKIFPDIILKKYNQRYVQLGSFEIPVILTKKQFDKIEHETFLPSHAGILDTATLPDNSGFFLIQQGSVLLGTMTQIAHSKVSPMIHIIKEDKDKFDAVIPVFDTCGSNSKGKNKDVVWEKLSSISGIASEIAKLLNKALKKSQSNDREFIEKLISKIEENYNQKVLFQFLTEDGYGLELRIHDLIQDYFGLYFDGTSKELKWFDVEKSLYGALVKDIRKYFPSGDEEKFRRYATDLWHLSTKIDRGLEWTRDITNSVVLWLAAQDSRLSIDKNLDPIERGILDRAEKISVSNKKISISSKSLLQAGANTLSEFISDIYKNTRFYCSNCEKQTPTLLLHHSKQGPLFSCSECGYKFVSSELEITAKLSQKMFVLDTSILIEKIPSYLVEQGGFENIVFIVSKATEMELSRLAKHGDQNKKKKSKLKVNLGQKYPLKYSHNLSKQSNDK